MNKPASILETCKNLLINGISLLSGGLAGANSGTTVGSEIAAVATNIVTAQAQSSAADAVDSVRSYDFRRFFSRSKKTKVVPTAEQKKEAEEVQQKLDAKSQGEADAGIVANAIISLVYSGAIDGETLQQRIQALIAFAKKEFGRDEVVVEVSEVAVAEPSKAPATPPPPPKSPAPSHAPSPAKTASSTPVTDVVNPMQTAKSQQQTTGAVASTSATTSAEGSKSPNITSAPSAPPKKTGGSPCCVVC